MMRLIPTTSGTYIWHSENKLNEYYFTNINLSPGMLHHVALVNSVCLLLVTANVIPSSPILVTLKTEALRSSERRFLQEPHGVTSQKTAFFIVTAVKTSNLT
jgi:hypothetical protein